MILRRFDNSQLIMDQHNVTIWISLIFCLSYQFDQYFSALNKKYQEAALRLWKKFMVVMWRHLKLKWMQNWSANFEKSCETETVKREPLLVRTGDAVQNLYRITEAGNGFVDAMQKHLFAISSKISWTIVGRSNTDSYLKQFSKKNSLFDSIAFRIQTCPLFKKYISFFVLFANNHLLSTYLSVITGKIHVTTACRNGRNLVFSSFTVLFIIFAEISSYKIRSVVWTFSNLMLIFYFCCLVITEQWWSIR